MHREAVDRLKASGGDTTVPVNVELDEQFKKQKCYYIHFDFLNRIKGDMQEMINAEDNPKAGILEVMKIIYHQFCSSEFDTEVNVSYGCKANIQRLFESQSDEEILAQFETYQDCLRVFHHAIVECYRLCCSVYGFQFRQYVRKHSAALPNGGRSPDPEGMSTPLADA